MFSILKRERAGSKGRKKSIAAAAAAAKMMKRSAATLAWRREKKCVFAWSCELEAEE